MPEFPDSSSISASEKPSYLLFLGWAISKGGGVAGVVNNLIRQCNRDGRLEPILVETLDEPPSEVDLGARIIGLPLPTPYSERNPLRALLFFFVKLPFILARLMSLCRRHRVRILNPHFVGLDHAALAIFRATRLFRGTLIFSFHGSELRALTQTRGWERKLVRWTLHGADLLVPCSEGLAEELLMIVPELAERIHPIQNGIDIAHFRSQARPHDDLPPSFRARKRLLNIGAFEYKKDHDTLLRAFAKLHKSRPDVCLLIAGQVREKLSETEALVAELGLAEDVLLLKNLPHAQVADLLQTSDAFVLSSRWEKGVCGEGFALALLEAGAMARPVVSTLSCGVSELIKSGESGLVVPPEDPEALADALAFMLDHPSEAAKQAANLHKRVREQFTWERAYDRYLTLAGIPGRRVVERQASAELVGSRS